MKRIIPTLATIVVLAGHAAPAAADEDAERLIAALLGDTPVIEDLRELTDSIGGRQTGTAANREAVAWAAAKFRQAEVTVTTEDFEMPRQWQETVVSASITGSLAFEPSFVSSSLSLPVALAASAQVGEWSSK